MNYTVCSSSKQVTAKKRGARPLRHTLNPPLRNVQMIPDLDENLNENLDKDLDENLAWLTQKTEDPKSNKGNLTFPTYTVNVIELNCKVLNNHRFFRFMPPF